MCNVKLDKYDDRIKCVRCSENVHIKCVNLAIQEYQKLNESDALKTWKCPDCVDNVTDDNATAADGGSDHASGKSTDLLALILTKINLIADKSDASCNCSRLVQNLIDENKKLSSLVRSQTKILNEMQVEFRDKISDLEKKIAVLESTKPALVSKDTELSRFVINGENQSKTDDDVVGLGSNEGSRIPREMSSPSATYAGMAGASTSKVAVRPAKQSNARRGAHPAMQDGNARCESYNDNDNTDGAFIPVISRRQKRAPNVVVGSRETNGASLKAVPPVGYVHVYRLDPGTSEGAVGEYLKQFIPDCKCEILNSKHPDVYSSFKITVPLNDVDKVMNPDVWPVGTRVNRYFHRRSPTKGPT